ncbi:hypothetical protein ACFVU2_05700 [Leifsonia sp. NPDC058194]|uniref:hypothetical protein n=1 Tax=Leifsonia sp. NPDC058194 TaxID=3346374 RepID=UPI0036D9D0D1
MSEKAVTCTLLVPGFGFVTCVTETAWSSYGGSPYTVLRSAVDEGRRRVDQRTWVRVERILGAR